MRVIIITPGGEFLGGGMGTVSRNIKHGLTSMLGKEAVKILDSRGESNIILSFFYFSLSLVKFVCVCIKKPDDLVVHVNVSERLSFYRKASFVFVANVFHVPCVLHHHGAEVISFYKKSSFISKFLVRYAVSRASLNLVLGNKWEKFIKSICDKANVEVLHNAVPIHNLKIINSVSNKFKISMLANLCERKGVVIALDALNRLIKNGIDVHIHFIGGGDVDKYSSLSKEMGVSNYCTFYGWVDSDEAIQCLASSDLLILPSYDEGLPMVILESMAQKVPVICTPVGSIPEVFIDREDCLFVDVGSAESLTSAIMELTSDKPLRDSIIFNAFRKYEKNFSLNIYSEKLLNIYKGLLKA